MSRIRGKGNRDTELALVKVLRANGLTGWRRHLPLPGKPDFTFRKQKVVVFVDGCFWHCCPRCSNKPVNNAEFWEKKLAGNIKRDRRVRRLLAQRGWKVVRIWEHEFRKPEGILRRLAPVLKR